MKDSEVVDAFVSHLRENGYPNLTVERRPDEENRDSSDIDAVAGPFAIEHTSMDTLPNQRRDADWYTRATGNLEQDLSSMPPFRLNICLEYDAVSKGQDWFAIRAALMSWINNDAYVLSDGWHVINDVEGVPFRLHVHKASDRRPGVFFARFEPNDETLVDRVRTALERKAAKLFKYWHKYTTVLLVESEDIALMNEGKMLGAIQEAFPKALPSGVDEVWYVDTSIPSDVQFRNFTSELG